MSQKRISMMNQRADFRRAGCCIEPKPARSVLSRCVAIGAMLVVITGPCTIALADSTPHVASAGLSDFDISSLVKQLDSDDFEAREEAEAQLATSLVSVKQIAKELSKNDLSPEQRTRLERIGYVRFERQERAAMGVQFSRSSFLPGSGVTIEHPTEGFDSARVLMAGDVLKSIEGLPILSQLEARPIIISFEPGDEVTVVVERAGETKSLRLRLGSFKDLQQRSAGGLTSADKRRAWQYRLVREGAGPAPKPVVAPFDPEQYRRVVGEERRRKRADEIQARNDAQAGVLPDTAPFRALNVVRAGLHRALTDDAATSFEPEPSKRIPVKTKDGLGGMDLTLDIKRQMRQLELQIRENSLRLKSVELPDEQRARLESGNRNNRVQLQNLRAQLRALQGDKPEAP